MYTVQLVKTEIVYNQILPETKVIMVQAKVMHATAIDGVSHNTDT